MSIQDMQDGYSGIQDGYLLDQVDELADFIRIPGFNRRQKLHAAKMFISDCRRIGWGFAWGWFGDYLARPVVQLQFL